MRLCPRSCERKMNDLVTFHSLALPGGLALRVSDHHHLEHVLGCAAVRAHPVLGHIVPAGAGRNALLWQPERLVIKEPAAKAYPPLKLRFRHFHCNLHEQSSAAI